MLLKSPVSRFGGKFYLRDFLVQHIPQHTLFCEVFCGAGHLLFSKTPSPVEVINDIDGCLIEFFKTIQHPETRQMLIDRLNYMPYSRALWLAIRTQWKQGDLPTNDIERVSQWFYLNRTCFSGDQKRGGFAVPSITGRNPVISFRNSINRLDAIAIRLRNICIENLPYQECIGRYDSEDTLFYVDPPYLNTEHYYGKDSFSQDDHRTLAEILHGVKGKAMVSHYANPIYDDLYRGWYRYEYQSFKGSHKSEGEEKPKILECLWTNFKPEVKLRAERRIGEFSKELPTAQGKYQQTSHDGESDKTSILKEAGITHCERYEAIASLPDEVFEKYIENVKASNEELTTVGILRVARQIQKEGRAENSENPLREF